MLNIMFIFVELKLLFNVPIDMHEGTNKISRKKKMLEWWEWEATLLTNIPFLFL